MTIPGSDGNIDLEYSPDPDHRLSAQELWFRACDKRISSLELQVHRMLNPEPISDEWLEAPEYMKGYEDGRASVTRPHWLTPPNVNEWLAQNNPPFAAAEWEALKEELETLRRQCDAALAETTSYKVMWESIPVVALDRMIRYGDGAYMLNSKLQARTIVCEWIDDRWPWISEVDENDNYPNAPKEAAE